MAFDEIGEPGKNDTAGHALGQRRSESNIGAIGRFARLLFSFSRGVAQTGELPVATGHTIDGDVRIAVDQMQELTAGLRHPVHGAPGKGHAFALPGSSPEVVEGEVGARRKLDGH